VNSLRCFSSSLSILPSLSALDISLDVIQYRIPIFIFNCLALYIVGL
jgi:hypothetical protein